MSKKLPRKKKIDSPQPVIQAPAHLPKPPRINSHTCLITNVALLRSDREITQFRVKRQYFKNLELRTSYWDLEQTDRKLQRIYPKMKFLRGFLAPNLAKTTYPRFFKKMRRFSRVNMGLILKNEPHTFYQTLITNLKPLTRLNLASLKIRIEPCGNLDPDRKSLLLSILMESLKYMSNLKALTCIIQGRDYWIQEEDEADEADEEEVEKLPMSIRSAILNENEIFCKIKRLHKIQKLKLLEVDKVIKKFHILIKDLEHLTNLNTVNLRSMNHAHGKELIERLCKIHTLTSVTLYDYFEPNDILSLAIKVPSLKSITIKNDWIFTSKDIPLLNTVGHGALGVTRLRFNLPLDIDSDEDVEFVVNFLSAFNQVRTLTLHVRTSDESTILIPIGKQISKLSQLQQLDLGVSIRSDGVPIPFLSSIDGMNDLKKISLTMISVSNYSWDRRSEDIFKGLKPLLLTSKVLSNVSINWNNFTSQCAESLKLFINGMKNLDTFHLTYTPVSDTSDYKIYKNQEKILSVFDRLFGQTTTVIKEVKIITAGEKTNKIEKTDKAAKSNNNIKKFTLTMKPRLSVSYY